MQHRGLSRPLTRSKKKKLTPTRICVMFGSYSYYCTVQKFEKMDSSLVSSQKKFEQIS
jgi:hypothetical protein